MKPHIIIRKTIIKRPLNEVFDFFSKAENLNLLTPPELQFKILTPLPIEMKKGTLIDYKIKLNGISFTWKTEISKWQQNECFVDQQLKGPYKIWHHTHSFRAIEGGTEMIDEVKYLSPGWIFEPIIQGIYIKKKVEGIFDYRNTQLKTIFPD
ncbi:MAG TPA: SRPBCC family protein [Bacteroidia bacterium]|nr:SRPBCC family protein [Bacteroidia bacterium]